MQRYTTPPLDKALARSTQKTTTNTVQGAATWHKFNSMIPMSTPICPESFTSCNHFPVSHYLSYFNYSNGYMEWLQGWRGGLVVGRQTCDQEVAGSSPDRDAAAQQLRQVVHTPLPLSPSSIIWYQRKLGGKQAHHATH